MERLTIDFSNLFKFCDVTVMDCSQDAMEEGLQQNIFVDYRRRGNKFECTTIETINNACKNVGFHGFRDWKFVSINIFFGFFCRIVATVF